MHKKQECAPILNEYTEEILIRIVHGLGASDDQNVEVTHELRKGLKRVRALVKLIRHKQPDQLYSETNVLLRNWGRIFSDLRDAHVRSQVLDQLREFPELKSVESDLNRLSGINSREISALEQFLMMQENKFTWVKQEIESTGNIEKYFEVSDLTREDVKAGLEKSFQKSFKSYQLVQKHNLPEDLHEWRKRLKDFQYQLEFIDRIGKVENHSQLELSDEINDFLGTDQDYFNLMIWLMYHKENFSSSENYSISLDQIKEIRSVQQKEAFKKATLLYDI